MVILEDPLGTTFDRRSAWRPPVGGGEHTTGHGVPFFVAGQRTGAVDTRGSLV
jgi:hypothetical protein